MDLAGVQRLTCSQPAVPRLHACTHARLDSAHRAPLTASSAGLGLVLLVGLFACGNPAPEGPVSRSSTGSADAVVAIPAGDASRTGLAAHQAATLTSPLGPPAPQSTTAAERRSPDAPHATSPASAASPATPSPSDAPTPADQAQREARELWFAELRESPDAMVRLQALEAWAQQPGTGIDPLTYALVDEDEEVRARAAALYEQQLAQEKAAAL